MERSINRGDSWKGQITEGIVGKVNYRSRELERSINRADSWKGQLTERIVGKVN